MIHKTIEERGLTHAVLKTARRSLFGPILLGLLATLALGEGARRAVTALWAGAGAYPLAGTLAVTAAGGLAAVAIAILLTSAIASLAAQPVTMLLEQLDPADIPAFHLTRGTGIGRDHLLADIKLMQRRSREVMRRSRLAIGELESAREKAQRQNLAKSQFLANMSHELRTPLNAILGYAMLLHEDASTAGDASAMEDLERIQRAGRDLLALINDILDLSKIDAGRAVADRVPLDVPALVADAVARWGKIPNGNALSVTVDEDARAMIGDPAKVRQCLNNLLGNAFKFTRDGAVDVRVSSGREDDAQVIVFQIADTGMGIAADQLDKLFDAFHQAESGASRHFGGAGLGLTIVTRLANLMGGACTVESEPGRGSTFRLVLPLGDPAANRIEAPPADNSVTRVVKSAESERTALVVDDDEAAIDLMQRWLTRLGYSVVCTTDAEATVRLAREHKADLVLLDVLLPRRSGYDLLKDLRAAPDLADTPTILITVDDDRARGLRAGAADYLRKPITETQLREVLDVYRIRSSGDVLVIDDDDDSAELLTRTMGQAGFSARRAVDGVQGLAMAHRSIPDAIVLDLSMPNMDGFEVLAHLAQSRELSAVPLIVVSGFDISIEDHRRLVTAGHRFFPKATSTPREIAQSVKELVA